MTTTNNTSYSGESLLVALTRLHVARHLEVYEREGPSGISPARTAQAVFDHADALEREAGIRALRRRVDEIDQLAGWLTEHTAREHRAEASARCVAFGMSLGGTADASSRAHGLLISKLAQKVAPGAINEEAIAEYVRHIEALAFELTRDVVRETRKAAGRRPDGWRPRFLAEVEREFGEPVAG